MNRNIHWLLDPGHGGVKDGVYQTSGKQYHHLGGPSILEGVVNRDICWRMAELLDDAGRMYTVVAHPEEDTPLFDRVSLANALCKDTKCAYISLHCNAGGGTGWEIYTSPGHTQADSLAEQLFRATDIRLRGFLPFRLGGHGDIDKEAGFYVLRKTHCPAVLIEHAFMDNPADAKLLTNPDFLDQFAKANVTGMLAWEDQLRSAREYPTKGI